MPRRDGTGPMGSGTMTGRGTGYCNPANSTVLDNQPLYFGGCGRGFRKQFCITNTAGYGRNNAQQYNTNIDEKTLLNNQEIWLENQLAQVKERLSKLD